MNFIIMNATKGGFFSKIQRFVTGKKATHCAIQIKNFYRETILDAKATIGIEDLRITKDYSKNDVEMWIFSLPLPEDYETSLKEWIYNEFNGQPYNFAGWLWFVYRRFNELILKKDIRKKRNWFWKKDFCSSIVYKTLNKVCLLRTKQSAQILCLLKYYNGSGTSFHAGDCLDLFRGLTEMNITTIIYKNELS